METIVAAPITTPRSLSARSPRDPHDPLLRQVLPVGEELRDADGYYWFRGRADDVIKVAGNRIGTAEVESALVSHEAVAEAAVIGKPHRTAGEAIKAFVILKQGYQDSKELVQSLKDHVLKELGKIAVPQEIDIVSSLPKTRSGKIMRRVLKAKELGQDVGDISTIED